MGRFRVLVGAYPTPVRHAPLREVRTEFLRMRIVAFSVMQLNLIFPGTREPYAQLWTALVGLTELRRRLSMACHESLSQRLVVRHHLTGLERDELDAYLTHRLRLAGCELPLFEPPAVEALFQGTRGLPQQINRIAHYALSAAALDNARTVNADHLQHALEELRP